MTSQAPSEHRPAARLPMIQLVPQNRVDHLSTSRRKHGQETVAETVRGLVAALQPNSRMRAHLAWVQHHAVVPADLPLVSLPRRP